MDGTITIGTEIDSKSFEAQIAKLEDELETMVEEYEAVLKSGTFNDEELKKFASEIEKTKNKIISLRKQQEALNKTDFNGINSNIKNIGKTITKVTKKVGKFALAVFGIRSAYMFVRQAVSTLSSGNEQLAADVEYLRYALASTLQPVIERLVELAYKLLAYLGYIMHEWFGVNIFANANKGLDKAVGSAKELKKQLAGFDEMNILQNSSQTGSLLPSYDLSAWQDIPIPNWVKWIAKNKSLLKMLGEVFLIAFSTKKITEILGNIAMLFGASGGMGLIGLSEMLLALSAPIIIYFVAKGLKEIINEAKLFNDEVKKNTETAKKLEKQHEEVIDTLIEKIEQEKLDNEQMKIAVDLLKRRAEQNGILNQTIEEQKNWIGELTGANKDLKEQQESLKNEVLKDIEAWEKLTEAGMTTKEEQMNFNDSMWTLINTLEQQGINVDELKAKYEKLTGPKYVLTLDLNTSEADRAFYKWVDKVSKYKISGNFSAEPGKGGGGGGGHVFAKGGIIYHKLPKLASGGIINQPGRGVPLGVGGERGQEGILPLTDNQQMDLLGQSIARHMVINLTNINQMNGRVISRELQKVQNESDFAFNR